MGTIDDLNTMLDDTKMSKFLENKQLVHIASEVVVLVGLVVYINQKHKKVMKHIEDMVQKIEDQEDMIQKHEEIIKRLVSHINSQQPIIPRPVKQTSKPEIVKPKRPHRAPPLTPPPSVPKPTDDKKVNFQENNEENNDSDLDSEMAAELAELNTTDEKEVNLAEMV